MHTINVNVMKTIMTRFAIAFFLLCVASCKKYDAFGNEIKTFNELKKANWLLGAWQKQTDTSNLVETWKRENDSTLTGTSFFILNKKDTLHREIIELVEKNNLLIYTSTIFGENNDEPVAFQKTMETETELIFENPKHNYPQKIVYKKISSSQLSATISGKVNGKVEIETYKLTKNK